MTENSTRLLSVLRMLAIGNALWVVPGLLPFDLFGSSLEFVRSGIYSLFSLLALVFMVMAAVKAKPAASFDGDQ